jgi:hypothetical protein
MCGYGMVGGCFTDIVLNSSKNYQQECSTGPRRLPKSVQAVLGAVILSFHGVANCTRITTDQVLLCAYDILPNRRKGNFCCGELQKGVNVFL